MSFQCKALAILTVTASLAGCGGGSTAPTSPTPVVTTTPPAPVPATCAAAISAEAEAGTGGELRQRSEASGRATRWISAGQVVTLNFQSAAGTCQVSVRYSNDNLTNAASETVEVTVDGTRVGSFVAEDTSGPTDPGGAGWNKFAEASVGAVQLQAGSHTATVAATGGDGFGIEIDVLRFN